MKIPPEILKSLGPNEVFIVTNPIFCTKEISEKELKKNDI